MVFAEDHVRKPAVSGQFYPGTAEALRKEVDNLLGGAVAKPDPRVRALISPHAGYPYSGPVAAEAYKTLTGLKFDTVIVIGFTHRVPFRGVFVDDAGAYLTPLGSVPVDRAMAKSIKEFNPGLRDSPGGRFEEHSVEVQIPFLQEVLKDFSIVPIYMGDQSMDQARILSDAVAKAVGNKNVLVVISTDLSHYYPYETAVKKDRLWISAVEQGNPLKLALLSDSGAAEACGMGPVMTLLFLREKMNWGLPTLLRYANSGDVTGDKGRVVGYAAMVCLQNG
jgi:AmmeMemoRadiSam system protein B